MKIVRLQLGHRSVLLALFAQQWLFLLVCDQLEPWACDRKETHALPPLFGVSIFLSFSFSDSNMMSQATCDYTFDSSWWCLSDRIKCVDACILKQLGYHCADSILVRVTQELNAGKQLNEFKSSDKLPIVEFVFYCCPMCALKENTYKYRSLKSSFCTASSFGIELRFKHAKCHACTHC